MRYILMLFGIILFFGLCYGELTSPAPDNSLSPQTSNYLLDIYNNHNILLSANTTPNTNIYGHRGEMKFYNNSGTFELWVNEDGNKTWQKI